MKETIQIELPEDFRTACGIFNFPPEEVIGEFTRRVSLPLYFSDTENKHRWANLFFLDYLDNLAPPQPQPDDIHHKYMDLLNKRVDVATNVKKREKAGREVLQEWHEAVKKGEKA